MGLSSLHVAARAEEECSPSLRVTTCCSQGGRRYMEDNVRISLRRKTDGSLDFLFVGVFDGHGGVHASEFAKAHLLENILAQPGFHGGDDIEIENAIREGFRETHQQMWKEVDKWPRTLSGFTSTSGTTASIAFLKNGKIYTGHVGDSAIVIGEKNKDPDTGRIQLTHLRLTTDHKPDSPEEERRITEAGGEVQSKAGVYRVVWMRPRRGHQGPLRRSTPLDKIPFLAVARSLGDLWSFNSETNTFVVSPEPDVETVPLSTNHCFLIFGSDGLWNVVHPDSAVDVVQLHSDLENDNSDQDQEQDDYWSEVLAEERVCRNQARHLVRHALLRWGNLRADNITAICVAFDHTSSSISIPSSAILRNIEQLEFDGAEFETDPDLMLCYSKHSVQAVRTAPVELVYMGQIDLPLKPPVETSINGFGYFNNSSTTTLVVSSQENNNTYTSNTGIVSSKKENEYELHNNISNFDVLFPKAIVVQNGIAQAHQNGLESNAENSMRKKPKYWCKKHGVSCEKAKQMNEAYEKEQNAKRLSATFVESNNSSNFPGISTEQNAISSRSVVADTASASFSTTLSVRKTAAHKSYLTPQQRLYETRASAARMTRSGTKFGLTVNYTHRRRTLHVAAQLKNSTRSLLSKRSIRKAGRQPSSHSTVRTVPETSSFETSTSAIVRRSTRVNGTYHSHHSFDHQLKHQLSKLKVDIEKSAHKFRIQKLKYCLKQHINGICTSKHNLVTSSNSSNTNNNPNAVVSAANLAFETNNQQQRRKYSSSSCGRITRQRALNQSSASPKACMHLTSCESSNALISPTSQSYDENCRNCDTTIDSSITTVGDRRLFESLNLESQRLPPNNCNMVMKNSSVLASSSTSNTGDSCTSNRLNDRKELTTISSCSLLGCHLSPRKGLAPVSTTFEEELPYSRNFMETRNHCYELCGKRKHMAFDDDLLLFSSTERHSRKRRRSNAVVESYF